MKLDIVDEKQNIKQFNLELVHTTIVGKNKKKDSNMDHEAILEFKIHFKL